MFVQDVRTPELLEAEVAAEWDILGSYGWSGRGGCEWGSPLVLGTQGAQILHPLELEEEVLCSEGVGGYNTIRVS